MGRNSARLIAAAVDAVQDGAAIGAAAAALEQRRQVALEMLQIGQSLLDFGALLLGKVPDVLIVGTWPPRFVHTNWRRRRLPRPAEQVSPDGNRRPRWLMRPQAPSADAWKLPGRS